MKYPYAQTGGKIMPFNCPVFIAEYYRFFQKIMVLLLGFILLLIAPSLWAAACSTFFPGALQTHSAGGVVTTQFQSVIYNSGTQLTTGSIANNSGSGWSNCSTGVCTASASAAGKQSVTIGASTGANGAISVNSGTTTKTSGHYTSVFVNTSAALTFSTSGGSYYFSSGWSIQGSTVITFAPGDYYVTGNIQINDTVQLKISGTGTVRIYATGFIQIGNSVTTPSVSSRYLLMYATGNISTGNGGNIHAFLYSYSGTVTLGYQAVIYGGASAPSSVELGSLAKIYYESTEAINASFGNLCDVVSTPTLHHFSIDVGGGTGSNCAAKSINIAAEDSSNAAVTAYTGTVTISTSTAHGDWAKTATAADAYGTLTAGSSDSGAATYQFTASDAGTITLNLTDTHAEALTITIAQASPSVSNTSSSLTFSRNAFVVTETDSLGTDIIAGRTHNLRVTMMKQDTTGTSCSAASGYNVAGVKMWLTRASADPAGTAPNAINGASVSTALPNSKPASNNVTLNFASGIANFTLSTSDVGKYAINFADSSNSFASSEITGSSSTYVVRPFGFALSVTGNTAATSATGTVFKKAGENFTVTATAKAWAAADDANNDGIPDNHNDTDASNNANLSDNTTLVKFGAETPAETLTLSSTVILPASGAGTLGDGDSSAADARVLSSFSSGVGSSTMVYFSEVGIIEMSAAVTDADYLGAGTSATAKSVSKSGYVGRFRPSHFAISSISVTPACSTPTEFNYMGQPFTAGFTLTAQSALNATTTNYTGSFAKLTSSNYQFKAIHTATAAILSSRISNSSLGLTWTNGVASPSGALIFTRSTSPDGPYSVTKTGLLATDSDSVTFISSALNLDSDNNGSNDSVLLRSTNFTYGRLRMDDAFGPETASLPTTFKTEYWNGTGWSTHTGDSCTAISASAITYPSGAINVVANRTVTVGTGTSTGSYTNLSSGAVNFSLGSAGQSFSAPGAGKTGNFVVNVNLSSYGWLAFDWNNDGNYTDTTLPAARMTFGNYRGNDRVLYWQEVMPN